MTSALLKKRAITTKIFSKAYLEDEARLHGRQRRCRTVAVVPAHARHGALLLLLLLLLRIRGGAL
jgi:hypothetical protein